MITNNILGLIKSMRREGRQTVTAFAEDLGLGRGHLRKIINGEVVPSVEIALKLAEEFGGCILVENIFSLAKKKKPVSRKTKKKKLAPRKRKRK